MGPLSRHDAFFILTSASDSCTVLITRRARSTLIGNRGRVPALVADECSPASMKRASFVNLLQASPHWQDPYS